jgi:hypothetical protein
MSKLAAAFAFIAAVSTVLAADPPTTVNYQGVLRDALDKPRAGTFDMVFRFYDALSAGNEILVDSHTGGGGNAVIVSGGVFNVQLGGGTLTDGSGAGTYAALDQVFRDFGAVYLQITVGVENLSPRIRVQSAAYALNASNLQGKPASGFVDTTGSTQTKTGHLVVNDGLEGNSASAVGVQGIGASSGGTFANQAITAVAHLGYNDGGNQYGVHGQGATAGGWFQNYGNTDWAFLARSGYGVFASGAASGGYFGNAGVDYAYAADAGYGLFAFGTSAGVYGIGGTYGGAFSGSGNIAYLASGSSAADLNGAASGAYAHNSMGDGRAYLGSLDYGLTASGSSVGALVYDSNGTGQANLGYGDLGVEGVGAQAGGHFFKPFTSAQAYLGASNGFYENGVYGFSNGSNEAPGYFVDLRTGNYVYVGWLSYKVYGSGSVNFVQNDPTDKDRVIVYSAPEGDDVAVYTRGSSRLKGGVATVRLTGTFASVANPDIGLTVQLTPRGSAVPLAVASVTTSELVVRGPAGGPDDLAFDYAVWGLRIGFESTPAVRPKLQEAFLPSMKPDEELLASHPQLRPFTAMHRFEWMDSEVDPQRATIRSYAASDALKSAIHVYDAGADAERLGTVPKAPDVTVSRDDHAPATAPPPPAPARPPVPAPLTANVPAPDPRRLAPPSAPSVAFPSNSAFVPVMETVEPGDVVSNDPAHPGELRRAISGADPGVVGIVAGDAGSVWSESAPVALAGAMLLCKVDATHGAIAANDLLVASPTAGHAMRAGAHPAQGTVVGKALEPWEAGTGTIHVLAMSR